MEIVLRPIAYSSDEIMMGQCIYYPPVKTDAISCTFNANGFSPMLAVLRSHCFDSAHFCGSSALEKWHNAEFRVHIHKQSAPLLLTTTKTRSWNDAPQATSEIIKTAGAEGCESLCLTHFMFLQGKFPKLAFKHCLQMAAASAQDGPLKRVIVDVDQRHMYAAKKILDVVTANQSYAQVHNLVPSRNVDMAEAGSADFQGWLAAEILCRSSQDDRCIEALKWLFLAHLIRKSQSSMSMEPSVQETTCEFLMSGMNEAQIDDAWRLAEIWLEERLADPIDLIDFVPEFRGVIASWRKTESSMKRADA